MKIRRRLPKGNKGSLKTFTDAVSTNTPGSAVSSITTSSSGADTALGRHQTVQKREMEELIDVMNSEEGQIVRRKLDMMDHSELTVAAL